MTSTLLAPPITLIPDASGLIAEIEAYLATFPAPARVLVPYVCPLGSTVQLWNAGFPEARPTFLDRIAHRPARPTPVSIADHLRLASRYINAFGWVQGALWDSAGRSASSAHRPPSSLTATAPRTPSVGPASR